MNPVNGSATGPIASVVAGNGLQQASAFDPVRQVQLVESYTLSLSLSLIAPQAYYYASFVFPAPDQKPRACQEPLTGDLSFVLNVVSVANGNVAALPFINNTIGIGEITTTLGYVQSGGYLVGAGSPIKYAEERER